MSTTKNGRRRKQIEFNNDAGRAHKENDKAHKRDACAKQVSQIEAKIARKGDWKFKTKKSGGGKQAAAAPKKDGKKPKRGNEVHAA